MLIPLLLVFALTVAFALGGSRLSAFETVVLPFLSKPNLHRVDCSGSSWPEALREDRSADHCGLLYYHSRPKKGQLLKVPVSLPKHDPSKAPILTFGWDPENEQPTPARLLAADLLSSTEAVALGVWVVHVDKAVSIGGRTEEEFGLTDSMGPSELGSFAEALTLLRLQDRDEQWVLWANANTGELAARIAARHPERTRALVFESRAAWTSPWGMFEKPSPITKPVLLIEPEMPPANLTYLFATILRRFKGNRVHLLVVGDDDLVSRQCALAHTRIFIEGADDKLSADCAAGSAVASFLIQ